MESVILNTPYLTALALLVVILMVFEYVHHSSGYFLPLLSSAVCVFVIIAALLAGAKLEEVLVFAVGFFLLALISYFKAEGKK